MEKNLRPVSPRKTGAQVGDARFTPSHTRNFRRHTRGDDTGRLIPVGDFAPLGSLTRVLEAVLRYVGHIDAILRDPEEDAETESREGRAWLESAIAMGEHWINIVIAARKVELLGLRHAKKYYAIRWSGWKPSVPRSIGCLLQRYERMRASLFMIDRLARRRAARIRAEMREAYLVEATAHPQADDAIFSSVIFCLEVSRAVILRAANLPIRVPP